MIQQSPSVLRSKSTSSQPSDKQPFSRGERIAVTIVGVFIASLVLVGISTRLGNNGPTGHAPQTVVNGKVVPLQSGQCPYGRTVEMQQPGQAPDTIWEAARQFRDAGDQGDIRAIVDRIAANHQAMYGNDTLQPGELLHDC